MELPPGTYSGNVISNNGCFAPIFPFTIAPSGVSIVDSSVQHLVCEQIHDGSVAIVLEQGVLPYTINWSTGDTTDNISGLSAGTYSVTVSDANGCTDSGTYVVESNPPFEYSIANLEPAGCNGEPNGVLDITVSGGVPPYTFNWSNGDTINAIQDLVPGTYALTATDSVGCVLMDSFVIDSGFVSDLTFSDLGTINCLADTVELSISPTGAAFRYLWSGPNVNGDTTVTVFATAGGVYSCTVSSINLPGCTSTSTFTVEDFTQEILASSSTNFNCDEGYDEVEITLESGDFPIRFELIEGIDTLATGLVNTSTFMLPPLDSGAYQLELFSLSSFCENSLAIEVAGLSDLAATLILDTAYCITDSSSWEVIPTGGTPPFTYAWTNGDTSAVIQNIPPSILCVNVTDALGCATTVCANNSVVALTAELASQMATCGLTDGSISTTFSGGTPPYTYNWSTGDVTATLENVGAGTYSLTVTDFNGCSAVAIDSISESLVLEVIVSGNGDDCQGGDLEVSVSPVIPGYVYNWTDPDL